MLLTEFFTGPITEGGNVFDNTVAINKEYVPDIVKQVKKLLKGINVYPDIGSAGYKVQSGDMDLMIDSRDLTDKFGVADVKEAKKLLQAVLGKKKLETKLSGSNVHVKIPLPNGTFGQVDIMVVPDAKLVAPYHQHGLRGNYDDPNFHGKDIFMVIASIAKSMNLKFEPFGAKLVRRDTGDLVARSRDDVARILLNPSATGDDLNSVKSILAALENDPRKDEKLENARKDAAKGMLKLPEGQTNEDAQLTERNKPAKPAPSKTPKTEVMNYGNWTITMTMDPVTMPKITGNVAMFVSKAEHKRNNTVLFGKGDSQAAARADVLAQINDSGRSENPDKFKSYVIDLNVDFTNEYLDPRSGNYFKMGKDDSGQPVLIMASKEYFANFGKEMEDLGFRRAVSRISGQDSTPVYALAITRNAVKTLGLIPNMRYTLEEIGQDSDGNTMFSLKADTRTLGKHDKYRMRTPGLTLAASEMTEGLKMGDYGHEKEKAQRADAANYDRISKNLDAVGKKIVNVRKVDMTGKICRKCHKGAYEETSQQDDWDGVLHCPKCGSVTKRWVEKKVNEVLDTPEKKKDYLKHARDTGNVLRQPKPASLAAVGLGAESEKALNHGKPSAWSDTLEKKYNRRLGHVKRIRGEVDEEFTGYWKGKDKGTPGKKMVGATESTNEEGNPTDKITMDIPLFIRMMEFAREDAKDDMILHDVTERAISLMQQNDSLSMDNYEDIIGGQSVDEEKIKGKDGKACWDGYRYNGTKNGKDSCVKVNNESEADVDDNDDIDAMITWHNTGLGNANYKGPSATHHRKVLRKLYKQRADKLTKNDN